MIDPLYTLSGFGVGALVGLTGVGGGSLMTPLLVLLFGVHPATAVGTDLLYAACTKSAGVLVHARRQTVDWPVVRRLASGSLPAAALTLLLLHQFHVHTAAVSRVITPVLGVAILLTVLLLLSQNRLLAVLGPYSAELSPPWSKGLTVAAGAVLGVLVTLTSVGAGALGVAALTLLYPRLSPVRIVGSDIAHAIPLTLLAGAGYWYLGAVDWVLLGSLLSGSVPGVVIGSLLATRVPISVVRGLLAATLALVAGKLLA